MFANRNKNYVHSLGKHIYIFEMCEILWLSLYRRDLTLFATWLKRMMERTPFKKHKMLIRLVHKTLMANYTVLFKRSGVYGFSLDVRGKLGVTGNAKKRHIMFTIGRVSLTTKKYPLHFHQHTVRTDTGVLGVTYYLMG